MPPEGSTCGPLAAHTVVLTSSVLKPQTTGQEPGDNMEPRTSFDLIVPALVLASLLGACAEHEAPLAEPDVREATQPLNLARHKQAAEEAAYAWFDPAGVREVSKVSTIGDMDIDTITHSETHFDNCYWNEGRDWVIANRNAAIAYAIEYGATGRNALLHSFYKALGFAIHASQDFYAHSNWVETHEPGVLASFNEPDALAPPGWYSGTFYNHADTGPDAGAAHCPAGTPTHAEMNKDVLGRPYADEAMFDAMLATSDQLARVAAGIRAALPTSEADAALAAVGFVSPLPATTRERADFTHAVALHGATLGFMTPRLFCRPGSFVAAFSQRVALHGADSTGLNSVSFECKQAGQTVEPLLAWPGLDGTWSDVSACGSPAGFITRGELKVEPLGSSDDESGATAARFDCSDGSALSASNDAPGGAWTGAVGCDAGEAVCGLQVTYQPSQERGDDTAMNGLTLLCCSTNTARTGVALATESAER